MTEKDVINNIAKRKAPFPDEYDEEHDMRTTTLQTEALPNPKKE